MFYSCHSKNTSGQFIQGTISMIPSFMQYLYYLCACNRDLLKSYYSYVLFCHSKSRSNIMKNVFDSISIYFSKRFHLNKYKRLMCYQENKSLNLYMKTGQIFPSKVCHFQFDHRFFFSREMGNIRTYQKIRPQKLIKFGLSGQYSFWHLSSFL